MSDRPAELAALRATAQRELDEQAREQRLQPWRSLSRRTVVVVDASTLLWLLDEAEGKGRDHG